MRAIFMCMLVLLLFQCAELKAASVPQVEIPAKPFTDSSLKQNFFKSPWLYAPHKKPGFIQKLEYKILQKRVKRLSAHRQDNTSGKNTLSTVSLLLGILALVTIFIPGIAIVALVAAPAAIATGIIALGKHYNNNKASRAKAIIGIVLGSLFILFFLVVLILFLSGGFLF